MLERSRVTKLESGTAELRAERARAHVRGDLIEPRARLVGLETVLQAPPGIQVGGLQGVLGFLRRPEPPEAVPVDGIRMALEEVSSAVALGCPSVQPRLLHAHCFPPT